MSKKNNNKIDLKITAPAVQFSFEQAKTTTFAVAGVQEPKTLYLLPFLPATPFTTVEGDYRSGIEFSYDADAIIATFNAEKRPLILDVDHNSEFGYSDTKARGWIYALFKDTDFPELGLETGMYAGVELTSLGSTELGDKLYGYTSAVVLPNKDNPTHFLRAKSLALTNNPATKMPSAFTVEADGSYTKNNDIFNINNKKENEMDKTLVISAFGLAADASDETIKTALSSFATIKAELQSTKEALETATAELVKAKTDAFESQCKTAVEDAVRARKITPAQKDAMYSFATSNFEAFKKFVDASPEVVEAVKPAASSAAEDASSLDSHGLTEFELKVAATLKQTPAQFAANKKAMGIA